MKSILIDSVITILVIAGIWTWSVNRPPETAGVKDESAVAISHEGDPIIATVNGEPIYHSDFAAAVQAMPEQMRPAVSTPKGRQMLGEQLVRVKLFEQQARKMGLDRDPEIASRVSLNRENILAAAAMEKMLNESDSILRQKYNQNRKDYETVDLRQIAIAYQGGRLPARNGNPPSREVALQRAQQIVQKLRSGADWNTVAGQVSDDPSVAQAGGALGTIPRRSFEPEMAEQIFALQPGGVSDPMVTPAAVHIFQVTDKGVMSFEQARAQLESENQNELIRSLAEKLRQNADVELKPDFFESATPKAD